jgi:hypothetical protein
MFTLVLEDIGNTKIFDKYFPASWANIFFDWSVQSLSCMIGHKWNIYWNIDLEVKYIYINTIIVLDNQSNAQALSYINKVASAVGIHLVIYKNSYFNM